MAAAGVSPGPVRPGTGWPGDVATPQTPVARTPADVERHAAAAGDMTVLDACVSVCRACPRLVAWREKVAHTKRRAFSDEPYWGRPITGWGAADATILVLGLAPAAHGGNRTGRVFTGDRSGDWLFAALHRGGLAELPTSDHAGDGQRLHGTRVLAAVRCAPPANAPTPAERATCAPWLRRELELLLPTLRSVLVLGGFAWVSGLAALEELGFALPRPRPRFGHGAVVELGRGDGPPLAVVGSYHPSQQNTFTGRLTEAMLDDVITLARSYAAPEAA